MFSTMEDEAAQVRGSLDLLSSREGLLSDPEGRGVLAVAPQDQVGDQPCPSGLVGGAQPLPRLSVEILVEQQEIAPVLIGAERRLCLQRWRCSALVAPIDIDNPLADEVGHAYQREATIAEAGNGKAEPVAEEAVELLDRLDQHVIDRQPDRTTPIRVSAKQRGRGLARNVFDRRRANAGQHAEILVALVDLAYAPHPE